MRHAGYEAPGARGVPVATAGSAVRADTRAPARADASPFGPVDDLIVSQRFGDAHVWAASWYPWYYLWSSAPEDVLLSADRASTLRAYGAACATVPLAAHPISPLAWNVVRLDEVEDGAIIYFALAAGPPDALLSHLRCHRAWLVVAEPSMRSESPLTLRGLTVTVHASVDTIEMLISVRDPVAIALLKERLRGAVQPALRPKAAP